MIEPGLNSSEQSPSPSSNPQPVISNETQTYGFLKTPKSERDKKKFEAWLMNEVGLTKYLDLFANAECDSFSLIFDLDEEGLEDAEIWDKMKKVHRKRFLRFRDEVIEDNNKVYIFFFPLCLPLVRIFVFLTV